MHEYFIFLRITYAALLPLPEVLSHDRTRKLGF